MSVLYAILEAIQFYWWLLGAAILAAIAARDFLRGSSLIARVLDRSFLSAAWALLRVYRRHLWLFVTWTPGRRFRAARLFAEIEILEPESPAPNPDDYLIQKDAADPAEVGADWHEANERWTADSKERKKRLKTLMLEQLKEEQHSFPSGLNQYLRSRYESRVEEPLRSWLGWTPSQKTYYVQVADFHNLNDKRDNIRRYFSVLRSMGETDTSFVAKVEIKWGYLTPLFLITGLINRFGETDGWKRIIDNYSTLLKEEHAYSADLREIRAFLFNCWLLWGPSIPRCTCGMWDTEGDDLILQYGYGDENNSLDLIIKDKGRRAKSELRDLLRIEGHRGDAPSALGAVPYYITGQLRWGPLLTTEEVGKAQLLVRGGSGKMQNPLEGRVVLQADWENCRPPEQVKSSHYYSAYLWVMFVILDRRTGQPYSADPWRNLLPYFEHANIAHAATYQALKDNLAAKICSSLAQILEGEGDLAVAYVCAFDDSHCREHGAAFVPVGTRLVDLLQDRIAGEGAYLATAKREGRLSLPDTYPPTEPNAYGSCHLPEIIEGFYKELNEAAETAEKEASEQMREATRRSAQLKRPTNRPFPPGRS